MSNFWLNAGNCLPLSGVKYSRKLYQAPSLNRALDIFEAHRRELVGSWLGRRVIVKTLERWKKDLSARQIIEVWQKVFDSTHQPQVIWDLWQSLARSGVALQAPGSLLIWQFQKVSSSPSTGLREMAHRVRVLVRLSLETLIYYFGFRPKYMFSAKSLWDMEHRFLSLNRLTSLFSSVLIGLYNAAWIVPRLSLSLGMSEIVWAKALLTTAVALSSLFLISAVFLALRRLLHVPPNELWNAINMNYQAKKGLYSPLSGCESHLKKLSQILCADASPIVWIRGHAGSGKTCLVQELARRLTLGHLPQELGQPQIFFVNSAHLTPGGYVSDIEKLELIKSELTGFEKQVILAFDECHLLSSAIVEQLKSWKDWGIRLILISNSDDETLLKLWGKDTLQSLESHTKATQIQMDETSKDLLPGMLQTALDENPHNQLTQRAKKAFIDAYAQKPGSPRLMSMALSRWSTKAKLLQNKTPELLEIANSFEALQVDLKKSVAVCDWEKAEKIAQEIASGQEKKSVIENGLVTSQLKLQELDKRRDNLNSLIGRAVQMAKELRGQPNEAWKLNLLGTLERVLQLIRKKSHLQQQEQLGSYPFLWDGEQIKELL